MFLLLASPTAQQSDADAHVTPRRLLPCPGCVVLVLGELTMAHEVPFQCSTSVWSLLAWEKPTDQQSAAGDIPGTLVRRLYTVVLVLGELTIAHEVPSQRSTSVWSTALAVGSVVRL